MITTRRTAESVARRFDRSRFLKRSAASISGFVAAGTVAGIFPPKALANHCAKTVYGNCSCVPVGGRYCNNCQDAGCPSDCGAYFGACPAGPNYQCWCTPICCYNCGTGNSYCGHWKCCDCDCPSSLCSCRAWTFSCTSCCGPGGAPLGPPCC